MTLQEVRERLLKALPLRIPQFDPNSHPRERVQGLADHILTVAYHRAELEEALYWTIEAGKTLKVRWDGHQGYEVALRGSKHTQEQVNEAKRRTGMREVWDGLQEAKALKEALERQINRMGGSDYDAASRAYTLLSGQ